MAGKKVNLPASFVILKKETVQGVERMLSPPHVHTGIKPESMRAWVPTLKPLPIIQIISYWLTAKVIINLMGN